ncbi:MAG: NAD(P)H-hydrate epimerase [Cyclobacteriaceae bacterium]|jgi:NAD(P)H-hydrate epimerase
MENHIPYFPHKLPLLSTEQMIEVDRLMMDEYQIDLIQMMENAGRCLASLANARFLTNIRAAKVIVLAGSGGNGGGAMVCARRLACWGHEVSVIVTDSDRMKPIPKHQMQILEKMGISVSSVADFTGDGFDLIIDGIIGYSLKGHPRGSARKMIEWANEQDIPILSLDTPSGIDLTSGTIFQPAIMASATLTLALPKKGLYEKNVLILRGELYLGDISVPPSLYAAHSLGLTVDPIFSESDILRLA